MRFHQIKVFGLPIVLIILLAQVFDVFVAGAPRVSPLPAQAEFRGEALNFISSTKSFASGVDKEGLPYALVQPENAKFCIYCDSESLS